MTFQYCPVCGEKAIQKLIGDEGEMPYCPKCEKPLFSFSYSCIITLVVDESGNFAHIKQYNIQNYICVAGYLKQGDSLEDAVCREVMEEIGLEVLETQYVKSYFFERRDQLMLGFAAHVKHGEFTLSGEVDSARWFTEDEAREALPPNSIALSLFEDYVAHQRDAGFNRSERPA